MLAKIWKKVLLAICIIACIYNIMSKIVNRHSLEENLKSANNGETVFDFSNKDNTIIVNNTDKTSIVNTEVENEIVVKENSNVVEEVEENSTGTSTYFNLDFLFKNT